MSTFSIDLAKFAQKAEKEMKTAIQKITMEAFKGVIEKTPVDTGRARANWGASVGLPSPVKHDVAYVDPSGSAAIGAAAAKVFDWNCIGSIYLCNNVEYISELEYGSSKQAPQGMVRVTLAEISAHYGR